METTTNSMDIENVISAAIEDAGDVGVDDTGSGDTGDTSVDTGDSGSDAAVTTDVVAAPDAAVAPVEDPFAKEHGLVTKRTDGRENRIPYSRVKAIAENQVKKAQAEWEAAVKAERDELGGLKGRMSEIEAIEAIMSGEPDRYIEMLAMVNPAYAKYAAITKQAAADAGVAPGKQPQDGHDDPMPEADYDLGNGQRTYSTEGLKALREWDRRQVVKEVEGKFDQRFKPIEDERKAAAERQKADAMHTQAVEKVNKTLETAQKWHGFKEHENEILKALQSDRNISLHDAYIQVVMPKIAADRTAMRSEILAEMNQRPAATSTQATQPAVAPVKDGSVEDIIRASISALNGRK